MTLLPRGARKRRERNLRLLDSTSYTPPSADEAAEETRLLSSFELLALQLSARGYTLTQIATLVRRPVSTVMQVLASAAERLGATGNWREAAKIAKRRGLIN